MIDEDIIKLVYPVIECFHNQNIQYQIGGSIASSIYGFPRTTADADLVADIKNKHIPLLVKHLEKDYFIQESAIQEAVRRQHSFNLIHLESTFKIDVFVPKKRPFDHEAFSRRRKTFVDENKNHSYYICSAEDTVLSKLEWYKLGGGISDRQWNDLIGVLKVQKHNLDKSYLLKWATELKVLDLLKQAFEDSGFEEHGD